MPVTNTKKHNTVKIIEPVNIYGCTLSENVFVGPFVEIQNNVFIGMSTLIQSHSFICTDVTIGENCFVGHGVMFVNDKFSNGKVNFSRIYDKTIIGNNVLIGSNATILPVIISDNIVIGAGSVVTKNLTKPGVYVGNPAKKIK